MTPTNMFYLIFSKRSYSGTFNLIQWCIQKEFQRVIFEYCVFLSKKYAITGMSMDVNIYMLCFQKVEQWRPRLPRRTQLTWIGAVRAKAAFTRGLLHVSAMPADSRGLSISQIRRRCCRSPSAGFRRTRPYQTSMSDALWACAWGRERGSGIAATRYPMKRIAVCCLQVIELSRSCGSCSENISTRLLYQYLNNYLYSKRPSYTFGGACNFKLRKKVRTRIRNFCIET